MRRVWMMASGLIWACGGSTAAPQPAADTSGAERVVAATASSPATASGPEKETTASPEAAQPNEVAEPSPPGASEGSTQPAAAKSALSSSGCTPKPNAEPKRAGAEDSVSEVADAGRPLHFDVAGISVEIPACTPDAETAVITVSWETEDRPISSHVDPKFTRHAATLRMDQPIRASEGSSLLVALHSRRELTKPGHEFVLAVEHSGECVGRYKRDKLEWGDCSHWKLHDAHYDEQRKEMVAEIPSTGGYRLQFGWMPAK